MTNENLIDNSFESAHKSQNIFGNLSPTPIFKNTYDRPFKPDNDFSLFGNTDYKTKTHDNNDFLLQNSFSNTLPPFRKDSLSFNESFPDDNPNLIFTFDKKNIR